MAAMLPFFNDPSKWVPLPEYQLSPTGQPFTPNAPRFPLGGGGPLGTPLFPQQQPAPMQNYQFGPATPVSFGGGGDSGPSAGTGMAPDMASGGLPFGLTGRDILGGISKAGWAFPNPISAAAGLANGVMSWSNMNNLDATRGAYGFPELNAGQRAGGVLGFNSYGTNSTAQDFNSQMAQAIAAGQPVTVPNVFGPTSPGGLNPGEVTDGGGYSGFDGGGYSGFDGVDTGSLGDMGYSGGFGIGW